MFPSKLASDSKQYITVAFSKEFLIYRSHSLTKSNPLITNLIFAIHGSERDGAGLYEKLVKAAYETNNSETTLVITPQFKVAGDVVKTTEFLWLQDGGGISWKTGGDAINASGAISSFEITDKLINKVLASASSYFPNLKRVTVTGHSAGGQFTHRYAGGSVLELQYPNVSFTYAPANPSTFLYLNKNRPMAGVDNGFMLPVTGCLRYDHYHYGLVEPNRYMAKIPSSQIISQLITRKVILLQGELDIIADDGLDISCGANVQGSNRFDRGLKYIEYLNAYFTHNHSLIRIPNVAHSSGDIYRSIEGRKVLWP